MFINCAWVGLGGFLGSISRYLTVLFLKSAYPSQFPLGTLAVNVIGCFAIGGLSAYFERHHPSSSRMLLFAIPGFLGGFTTFSAFSAETISLLRDQHTTAALMNVFLSLFLGFGAVILGRVTMG